MRWPMLLGAMSSCTISPRCALSHCARVCLCVRGGAGRVGGGDEEGGQRASGRRTACIGCPARLPARHHSRCQPPLLTLRNCSASW